MIPLIFADNAQWLVNRRTGIGGSDAPAILGISPYATPYDVWAEKIGEAGERQRTEAELFDLRRGKALEDFVAGEYEIRTGDILCPGGFLRHAKHEWLMGTLDRVTVDGRPVEIKTARNSNGWGEPGTDEVPLHVLAQVQHYLMLTGAEQGEVAALIAGAELRLYSIPADQKLHEQLYEREEAFWTLVKTRTPPPVTRMSEAVARWGGAMKPGLVQATEADIEAVAEARALQERVKRLTEQLDRCKATIMASIGGNGDTLVDNDGHILATWRMDKGRAGYTVGPTAPARRLLIKG